MIVPFFRGKKGTSAWVLLVGWMIIAYPALLKAQTLTRDAAKTSRSLSDISTKKTPLNQDITVKSGNSTLVGTNPDTTATQNQQAVCGNGFVEQGEECDEGASNNDTGTCTTQCQFPRCGDGIIQNDEECDDGNNTDGDSCTANCIISCAPGTQETCDCTKGCPYGDPKYPDCKPENDNTVCDWTGGSRGCSATGVWGYCVKPTEAAQPVCEPTQEVCDGKDNDCNGQVDDGIDCNQTSTFTCPSGESSQGIGCFATAEKNQVVCYNEKGEKIIQASGFTNVTGITSDPSSSKTLIWGHDNHLHFIMNEPVAEGSTVIKDYTVQTTTMDNLAEGVKIADLTRGKDHVYVLDTEGKIYGYGETPQITETLDFGEPMKWITMTLDGKLVGMTMNGILKTLATSEVTEAKQNQSGEIDAKSYLSQKGYSLESPDGVVYENMIIFTNSAANQIVLMDTSKFSSPTPDTATLDAATTLMNVPFTPSAVAMRTDVKALAVSGLNDGQTYFISGKDNKYTSGQTYTLTADDLQTIATPEAQGATSLDGWQGCEGTFDSGELTDEVCDGQDNDGDGVVDNGLDPETCCFDNADCDDGDLCTTDTCDLVVGTTASQCHHEPSNPDDSNVCTTDSCDPTTGDPINSPIDNCCMTKDDCTDDGNACTNEECVPGQSTIAGVTTGECSSTTVDPNDGDACTTDLCDPTTGLISNTPIDKDDGDTCTTDSCDSTSGAISHTEINVDDEDACTTDSCDPVTGEVSHVDVSTDDDNACTVDACDQNTGEITHVSTETNDNDACTEDACNTTTGEVTHTPVSVDDGNACTTDLCNSTTGEITHLAGSTDDGDSCTIDACDPTSGEITNTPVDVDDGNSCTVDTCLNGEAVNTPIDNCCYSDSDCDDGNACNGTETCISAVAGSTCQDGTPPTCDDSNDCTTDTCDASAGCQYAEVASAAGNTCGTCGDGLVNTGEECDDGNTDDTDGCTADCKEVEEEEGYCGDGEVQSDLSEECDGSAPDGYECTFKCTLIEEETCDDGSTPSKALCIASSKKIECLNQDSAETRKQYEVTNDPVSILADQNRLLYVHDSQKEVATAKVTTADPLAQEEMLAQTKVIGFDQQAQAIVWDSANNRIAILKEGALETLVADVSMKAAVVGDRDDLWVLGSDLNINKYKAINGTYTVDKQIDLSATLTDADEIKKLAFAKNQIFIATATRVYNADARTEEIKTLLTDADIAAMAVDPRTKQIFVADSQGTIRTFDPDTTYSAKRPDELTVVKADDPKEIGDLTATDACPESDEDEPQNTADDTHDPEETSTLPEEATENGETAEENTTLEAESAGTETGTVTEQTSENEDDEEELQVDAEGVVTTEECIQGDGILEALEDPSLLLAVQNGEIDNINGDPVVYEDGMIKGVCTGYTAKVLFTGGGCLLQKRSINPTASASIFFLLILSNFLLILPIKSKVR